MDSMIKRVLMAENAEGPGSFREEWFEWTVRQRKVLVKSRRMIGKYAEVA